MMNWLAENWGTIVICVVLAVIVTVIILKLHKDRKAGISSCGGNCKACAGACHACRKPCHSTQDGSH